MTDGSEAWAVEFEAFDGAAGAGFWAGRAASAAVDLSSGSAGAGGARGSDQMPPAEPWRAGA